MDILARIVGTRQTRLVVARSVNLPKKTVLSTQVSGARYFFIGLAGTSRGEIMPAYGGFEQCNADYLVQREHSEFSTLELVVGGEGVVTLNDRRWPLRAGICYHYDASTRLEIRTDPAKPMAKYFLCLTGRGVRQRLAASGVRPNEAVELAMFPEVQRVLEDLIREGGQHRAMAGAICRALAEVLLLKIEELVGVSERKGPAGEETFLRCKGTIEAQTATLSTLTDITKAVGVEASHLCRLFRRYQGVSPYQYLLRCKMTLAAEHLMDPATLVKEAAAQVGFSDPYHFSRCFKKVHRVAPKHFQRSLKHLQSSRTT